MIQICIGQRGNMLEQLISQGRSEALRGSRSIKLADERASIAEYGHCEHQPPHLQHICTILVANPMIDNQRNDGWQKQFQYSFNQFK